MQYGSYFLFAGRMVPYKGVDVLLKAMLKVQDANLVLIGVGRMLDEWKALSKKLNLESRVHFVGKIESDDEFAAFVHGARALVLPSINEAEAFGLVLLEAMSCAKPVITTNLNSGVRFVNKANETGLMVPVMDVERLGEAMNRLLQDDVLYARLSKNAYEHFQNHFLISTCFARHEQIYQNLLQKLKRTA